jgi:hypothetical protein
MSAVSRTRLASKVFMGLRWMICRQWGHVYQKGGVPRQRAELGAKRDRVPDGRVPGRQVRARRWQDQHGAMTSGRRGTRGARGSAIGAL